MGVIQTETLMQTTPLFPAFPWPWYSGQQRILNASLDYSIIYACIYVFEASMGLSDTSDTYLQYNYFSHVDHHMVFSYIA